jgi:hypothetical protein
MLLKIKKKRSTVVIDVGDGEREEQVRMGYKKNNNYLG